MMIVSVAYAVAAVAFLVGIGLVAVLARTESAATHAPAIRLLYIIPGAAGVAYVLMAFDIGTITVAGTDVLVPRYVDWLVTTPVLIWVVGYVADAPRRLMLGAAAVDAVMIAIGFVATVTTAPVKYVAFAVSSGCHFVLLAGLYRGLPRYAAQLRSDRRRLFHILQNHVGLLWVAYPLVWLVGPIGLDLVAPAGIELIIPYLDVVAKVPFIYFIYIHRAALTGAARHTAEPAQAPADVGAD